MGVKRSYTPALKLKEPKTRAGFRTIALDHETAAHLADWKVVQAQCLATLGEDNAQSDETPVCCTDVGGLYDPTNFYRWWDVFRKEHGFETLKFHELRHTQATQLLANGVDVKTVQTRMGHANASITLNWYAHAVPDNDRMAAKIIGNLFSTKEQVPDGTDTEDDRLSSVNTECAPTTNPESTRQGDVRIVHFPQEPLLVCTACALTAIPSPARNEKRPGKIVPDLVVPGSSDRIRTGDLRLESS